MLRYSLPSQTRTLHKVAAGLVLLAALSALLTGLIIAGTIDIPSLGDDAEADQPVVVVPSMHQSDPPLAVEKPKVNVPSMHQSDPPLPAEQPVVQSNIVPSMHQSDPPLPAEQADDINVEHAPWLLEHLEP
jgi:hypothetical protein